MNNVRDCVERKGFPESPGTWSQNEWGGWLVSQSGSESGQWNREMLDRFARKGQQVSCWLCLGNSQPWEGSLRISRAQMSNP